MTVMRKIHRAQLQVQARRLLADANRNRDRARMRFRGKLRDACRAVGTCRCHMVYFSTRLIILYGQMRNEYKNRDGSNFSLIEKGRYNVPLNVSCNYVSETLGQRLKD